jgi:adenylate cyclase
MIIGQDAVDLTYWAVGFQRLWTERPLARIGVHQGVTLYRDGDYYGRDVNLAARVVARSRGGEVLVSGAVAESLGDERDLRFDNIGQVKLKGFDDPVQLCRPVVEE